LAPWCRLCTALAVALLLGPPAAGQELEPQTLRLQGVLPGGGRTSVTESWATFDFSVTNLSDADRLARVLAFYEGQQDVQYGRDLWVPARSTRASWLLVGPAPEQPARPGTPPEQRISAGRDMQLLLYDRTDGKDHLILPRGVSERVRSRVVLYHKREPYTAIVLDDELPGPPVFGRLPQPESKEEQALRLARTFRAAVGLSETVHIINPGVLPPTPQTFDGVDHVVLASGRLARDPAGMQALRHWLERGGTVWVMLDLVDAEAVAPLVGDALDFEVVDRVSLTGFRVDAPATGERVWQPLPQNHERPVDLVRVLLPPHERAPNTVNGWPAWFVRRVGRGKVVFTTLGPRGWYRERTRNDQPSPFLHFPSLPVPTPPLELVAGELQPPRDEGPFPAEAFRQPLSAQIGYAVLSRGTVGLICGAFLAVALALGVALRRWRRPELLGWLGPAAALAATAAFLVLGEASRRAAPPTLAVAQVADAVPGTNEAAVQGLLAVYRPDSGLAEIGAAQGGFFDLDMTGIEGQTRRLVLTDQNAWHWENLDLPAGVRFAPFHSTVPTTKPLAAVARFGPEGLDVTVAPGPFEEVGDVLLQVPGDRNLAARPGPQGAFRAGPAEVLSADRFVTGALLTDQQQRRQALYREFLKRPMTARPDPPPTLLAWAKPVDLHFTLAPGGRTDGTALLVFPLRFQRPAAGAVVTIPGPLVSYRRVVREGLIRPQRDARTGIEQDLRFQLPPAVLPFQVERARFLAKIEAPSRRVTVSGRAGDKLVEIGTAESPLDPIEIDIKDGALLRLDDQGGLQLNLKLSDSLQAHPGGRGGGAEDDAWKIEYLELEVKGRAE
jgi:hypothetical protein